MTHLENFFSYLLDETMKELQLQKPTELSMSLLSVPLTKRRGLLDENVRALQNATSSFEICIILRKLISFIDCGLLEHMVHRFGSKHLNMKMKEYIIELQLFMNQTTVQQLENFRPGEQVASLSFILLKEKADKPLNQYSLAELEQLRTKFCSEVELSQIVSNIVGESSSKMLGCKSSSKMLVGESSSKMLVKSDVDESSTKSTEKAGICQ